MLSIWSCLLPWSIVCANVGISDPLFCLCKQFSLYTGTTPDSIRSCRTLPGPTLFSWRSSPTRMTSAPSGMASNIWYISTVSAMEVSSRIYTSCSSGLFLFLLGTNWVSGRGSSMALAVLAYISVCSSILCAAQPVVAAKRIWALGFTQYMPSMIPLIVLVFPDPGGPVKIHRPPFRIKVIAFFWLSSNWIPNLRSINGIFESGNKYLTAVFCNRRMLLAILFSIR